MTGVWVQEHRWPGWWAVMERRASGTERLFAGPFRERERADELAAKVNETREVKR